MPLPTERLDGGHAIVTGGGRGLGRSAALALAELGARVTLMARSEDELEQVAGEIETAGGIATVRPADVCDEASTAAAFAAADAEAPLSVLVAAAGLNRTGPSVDYSLSDWDTLMAVNVRGTFVACQAFGALLLGREGRGRIVTVSSQMGTVGFPGRAAYCATKHAVNGLTKALAVEWAPHGIAVNAVAPTFVLTPLTEPMFRNAEFAAEVARRIPDGQIAALDDVAAAVAFLAGDRGASVTGHILAVDRGWTAW